MEKIGTVEVTLYSHTLGCGCHQNIYIVPGYGTTGKPIQIRVWRACNPDHGHNFDRQPQAHWVTQTQS